MPRSRCRRQSRAPSSTKTSRLRSINAMKGRKASRPGCPANRSPGFVLLVATTTTPRSNRASNSRPRIIASAMSLTWNSSKQSSAASAAILVRERQDRVRAFRLRPAPRVDAGVRLLHELVEVDAPLARDLRRPEEQVHQHGLAPPDLADEVEAVRTPLRDVVRAAFAPEQTRKQARRLGGLRVVAAERRPQRLQTLGGERLCRVGRELAARELGAIGGKRSRRNGC